MWHNLVESVGSGVMIIEVKTTVLNRCKRWHACFFERLDVSARVLGKTGSPIEGLCAAGVDAGGWSTGGYASGLAAALVFGRIAAEQIAS